uniref:ER membrane protein complex subunit 10 n=1 Tax=Ciona intestinalis TaxID=7719 RepID=F6Y4Z5_CIOIN|nr:ER membrane protein complex subunit 10 isoform X2 [Ciona intestinalis]|eukprot:XP_009858388.1 ER membrane protein complex subunit 10 isoform X2 [Ciona intestinalis]
MWCNPIFVLLFECSYLLSFAATSQDVGSGYLLSLEHSFGDTFTKRGDIYFPNVKGENAVVQNEIALSMEEIKELEKLAINDDFYRVRVSTKVLGAAPSSEDSYVVGIMPAKQLLEANLSTKIDILTDGIGNIISIGITPSSFGIMQVEENEFDSSVTVSMPTTATVPDTYGYLNKMEMERRKKEIADKQPTSFFGKYWMYILPVVVFVMMSNAAQQQ